MLSTSVSWLPTRALTSSIERALLPGTPPPANRGFSAR